MTAVILFLFQGYSPAVLAQSFKSFTNLPNQESLKIINANFNVIENDSFCKEEPIYGYLWIKGDNNNILSICTKRIFNSAEFSKDDPIKLLNQTITHEIVHAIQACLPGASLIGYKPTNESIKIVNQSYKRKPKNVLLEEYEAWTLENFPLATFNEVLINKKCRALSY